LLNAAALREAAKGKHVMSVGGGTFENVEIKAGR